MESDRTDEWEVLSEYSTTDSFHLTSLMNKVNSIHENKQINNNELVPSYIDIESELQKQKDIINELKFQLNDIKTERDQIREERDDFKVRLNHTSSEITRLKERNFEINRHNICLRAMTKKYRGRKLKKIRSKTTMIRGHRPTVPAKLRFRRQRTTHRTAYGQSIR
eukprot:972058_1